MVSAIAGMVIVGLAALQIRLGEGPIEIAQLVGPIERGLSREFGDTSVRIGSVALFRSEQTRRIEFRLGNLRLVDDDGATVVRVPTAAIDISRTALMQGTIAPKRIDLIRPRLVLSYDDSAGLSLRFAGFQAAAEAAATSQVSETPNAPQASQTANDEAAGEASTASVGLVKVLQDTFKAARERRNSTSFLQSVGVRDAVIVLRTAKRQTVWTAPELALALRHQSARSIIRGNGTLTDGVSPWNFAFEIDDTPAKGAFHVRTLFKDLVPGEFGRAMPELASLNALETPLSGQADFALAKDGTLAAASADVVIGAGFLSQGLSRELLQSRSTTEARAEKSGQARQSRADRPQRLLLDEGHIKFDYDKAARKVRLEKLDLATARGRLVLAGTLVPPGAATAVAPADGSWRFDVTGKMRFAGAGEADSPVSDLKLSGAFDPPAGSVRMDRINMAWPEGQLAGRGQYSKSSGITLAGQIGETSKAGLLQAWPPFLAVDAREWIVAQLEAEQITGGQFSISLPSDFQARMRKGSDIPAEAVSFDISVAGATIAYLDDVPTLYFPKATAAIRGRTLRVKAPLGRTRLPSGQELRLEQSDFVVRDLRLDRPEAQIFMRVKGRAAAVVDYLSLKRLGYMTGTGVPDGLQGQASGFLRLQFPLHPEITNKDVRLNGKVTLTGGAARNVFGNLSIAGGDVVFDLTDKAVEANGAILVNGVPATVRWLRLLDGGDARQPPLRISAKLDADDRKQIGLNVNHFVKGVIATDIAIIPVSGGASQVSVQADLSAAEIVLGPLAWRKAAGQSAVTQFDVVGNDDGTSELQNFKVVGSNIAIDGSISLGKDNRVQRFSLPEFSLDLITRMDVSGTLDTNNFWDIKVRSTSFDARPVFKALFAPSQFSANAPPVETRRDGLTIRAFIKTMVGFNDQSLKDVQVVFQRRGGKIVGLEANGALDSGAPIAVSLKPNAAGQRVLFGETKDAGAAFRLIGFYRNIRRGEAKLQVNLDDPGLADVSGVLWSRKFYMLGDTVVNEVLQGSGQRDEGGRVQGIRTNRDERGQRRTVIEFDQLRFNFSVGSGQFLLQESYVNGPALGATLSGKVDFDRRLVNLGGTYIPLYGLNSAIGAVPILGDLLVGRRGEGIFGVTFGVQGRLDNPDVLVNPVSLVAPGIFRQIFEINPQRQSITPRRSAPGRPSGTQAKRRDKSPSSSSWPAGKNN